MKLILTCPECGGDDWVLEKNPLGCLFRCTKCNTSTSSEYMNMEGVEEGTQESLGPVQETDAQPAELTAHEFAIEILQARHGWNREGAEAIVDALLQDGSLQEMTITELLSVSEDYMHR